MPYALVSLPLMDNSPSGNGNGLAPSLSNELARERNREAADRTLLAWIRTSLAMISLGFGTQVFGASLIVLGMAATLAGMWEHRHMLAAIRSDDYRYSDRPPIARSMGWALVLVGAAALAAMLGM